MAKVRNWLAVRAHFRSGAGHHGDAKKDLSKNVCRDKIDVPMNKYKVVITPAPIEYEINAPDDDAALAAAMDDFKKIDAQKFAKVGDWSVTLADEDV